MTDYKIKLIKRIILLNWIVLAVYFSIKIFGYNLFEIICNNERFIMVCEFVDKYLVVKIIIGSITSYTLYMLYYLSIARKWKFNKLTSIILLIIVILCSSIRFTYDNLMINTTLDIIQYIAIPLILTKSFIMTIINVALLFAYMYLSAFTKNINLIDSSDSTLTMLIFSVDIYILLILNYLYFNLEKGEINMGLFMGGFFSKKEKQLIAYRAKVVAKHEKKLVKIDTKIAKAKNTK